MYWPDAKLASTQPNESGISTTPEDVAEAPSTRWT
jgi:hypothetical protein